MKKSKGIVRGGLVIFFLIGTLFLFLEALKLSSYSFLKSFNLLFVLIGVRYVVRYNLKNESKTYIQNLVDGVLTSVLGVGLSVFALVVYLLVVAPEGYYEVLAQHSILLNGADSFSQFIFSNLFEGIGSSVVVAYILMQRYKNVSLAKSLPIVN